MKNIELKKKCIQMYLQGKTYSEISKLTGKSRTYITNLIKNDPKIKEIQNTKKIKVYKRKNNKQMIIYIPRDFIKKIGITEDRNNIEYVDISFNEFSNSIIIKKHS